MMYRDLWNITKAMLKTKTVIQNTASKMQNSQILLLPLIEWTRLRFTELGDQSTLYKLKDKEKEE